MNLNNEHLSDGISDTKHLSWLATLYFLREKCKETWNLKKNEGLKCDQI